MPIYEYGCEKCEKKHEILRKVSDSGTATCPDCGCEMKKLVSNSTFRLKGSGFYVNDYHKSLKKLEPPKNVVSRETERETEASNVINNTEAPSAPKAETTAK